IIWSHISDNQTLSLDFKHRKFLFLARHNALLRCEQRNTAAAAYHLKHQTQRIVKMPRVANLP
ncbi:TPA: hypothetical protein ACVO0R_004633, partial [Vibrio alginolyticus]